jgi:cyclic pyranopterin phosphate synthase
MRGGSSDEEITAFIRQVWEGRGDHYSEVRSSHTAGRRKRKKIEMSYIGG